jgi:hypothetical protein
MPDTNAAYEAPVSRSRQCPVAAVGTAGNDLTTDIAQVDADGVISSVKYIPAAGITGANTNTRKVLLVNKHADGSGATAVATLQFNSGVNATADVAKTITLSGTAADLAVSAGDVLQWQSTHLGSGITDPGGLVVVVVGRT